MSEELEVVNDAPVDEQVDSTTTEESPAEETVETEVSDDSEVVENTTEDTTEGFVPRTRLNEQKAKYEARIKELEARHLKVEPVLQPVQAKEISVEDIPQNLYDAEGNLDPIGYANWVVKESATRAREASRQERQQSEAVGKAWAEAESTYPELKDPEVKSLVDMTVRGAFVQGQFMTPKDAAAKILGRVRSAEQSGIKKAQVSTEIQKNATVPATESNPAPATTMEKTFLEAKETGDWDNFFESFVKSK